MSLALLFPGQGVQHAAMLPWLDDEPDAEPVLARMAAQLGADWRARLHDDNWASRNEVAQPLMTGVALAAWRVLKDRLPRPAMVAGYSVGELAAFSVAGLYDASTAIELARQRAALMDACDSAEPAGLLSVRGASVARVDELCARFGVSIAIDLGVERCVLGGSLAALAAATPQLQASGAELTPLRVRVASHTAAMAAAATAFAAALEPMAWPNAECLVVCDLDGVARRDAASLKHALARQIDHTVQWRRCMTTLAERRPDCVLELGPGTTLGRLLTSSCPDITVRSADEFHSAQAIVDWVRRAVGPDRAL
ncbi:MAG: acyltransferase domain-containing protein [Burkholderiales bacterium]